MLHNIFYFALPTTEPSAPLEHVGTHTFLFFTAGPSLFLFSACLSLGGGLIPGIVSCSLPFSFAVSLELASVVSLFFFFFHPLVLIYFYSEYFQLVLRKCGDLASLFSIINNLPYSKSYLFNFVMLVKERSGD